MSIFCSQSIKTTLYLYISFITTLVGWLFVGWRKSPRFSLCAIFNSCAHTVWFSPSSVYTAASPLSSSFFSSELLLLHKQLKTTRPGGLWMVKYFTKLTLSRGKVYQRFTEEPWCVHTHLEFTVIATRGTLGSGFWFASGRSENA